jgi:hypothetical protein
LADEARHSGDGDDAGRRRGLTGRGIRRRHAR